MKILRSIIVSMKNITGKFLVMVTPSNITLIDGFSLRCWEHFRDPGRYYCSFQCVGIDMYVSVETDASSCRDFPLSSVWRREKQFSYVDSRLTLALGERILPLPP